VRASSSKATLDRLCFEKAGRAWTDLWLPNGGGARRRWFGCVELLSLRCHALRKFSALRAWGAGGLVTCGFILPVGWILDRPTDFCESLFRDSICLLA
jgi:hypothetical protein